MPCISNVRTNTILMDNLFLSGLRLAGADAATLLVGALTSKYLLYLTKIASTLQMQTIASVTSELQVQALCKLSPGSITAIVVSNRNLETFGFDESGQQALNLLKKDSLNEFRNVHSDVIILVEGRGYPLMKEANEKSKEVSISEAVDEDELNKLKMAWRIPFK